MKLITILLLMLVTLKTQAVDTYTKLYIHHILTQPAFIDIGDYSYTLEFKPVGLELESALLVKTENGRDFVTIGIGYWDSGKNSRFNTKRVEVFYDYTWSYQDDWYGKVGAGVRVYGQTSPQIKGVTPPVNNNIINLITARFEFGRTFGDYAIFLNHHSQWLRGRPFTKDWEYYTTSVGVSYKF